MGFITGAMKHTVRRTATRATNQAYRDWMRANDRRLRQQGPTHGYGPDGRYGRIGREHEPKWGFWEYLVLILGVTTLLAGLAVVGMIYQGTLTLSW